MELARESSPCSSKLGPAHGGQRSITLGSSESGRSMYKRIFMQGGGGSLFPLVNDGVAVI